MNTKNLVTSAVVAVLLVAGLVFPIGKNGTTVVEKVIQAGAVSGPDTFFPCETHNGVTSCFSRIGMAQATTTVCAIKSPTATSTIEFFSASWQVGSTTAATYAVATSTTPFATTTALTTGSIPANTQAWSTFNGTTGSHVMAPNTFIVVSMAGGSGISTFSPTGTCEAQWDQI